MNNETTQLFTEIVHSEQLENMLKNKQPEQLVVVDRVSVIVHRGLHQEHLQKAIQMKRLSDSGFKCIVLIEDFSARRIGDNAYDSKIEHFGKSLQFLYEYIGVKCEFIWSSDIIREHHSDYFKIVFDISNIISTSRIKRTLPLIIRKNEHCSTEDVMKACMECAFIIHLKADICVFSIACRKIAMLAREYAELINVQKPVTLLHTKVSTGIFYTYASNIPLLGTLPEVNRVIRGARCSPTDASQNFLLDIIHYIIIPMKGCFLLERCEDYGGTKLYMNYSELQEDYQNQKVHPSDLKSSLSKIFTKIQQQILHAHNSDTELVKLYKMLNCKN
jgi:tyrosyl-tRNA synthetase